MPVFCSDRNRCDHDQNRASMKCARFPCTHFAHTTCKNQKPRTLFGFLAGNCAHPLQKCARFVQKCTRFVKKCNHPPPPTFLLPFHLRFCRSLVHFPVEVRINFDRLRRSPSAALLHSLWVVAIPTAGENL